MIRDLMLLDYKSLQRFRYEIPIYLHYFVVKEMEGSFGGSHE